MSNVIPFTGSSLRGRIKTPEEKLWLSGAQTGCLHKQTIRKWPATPDEERHCKSCGAWWYVYQPGTKLG